ncbi:MAG: adenylate/guanylate cyclase domain-containing protein [Rhodocyclaceae bacterium]|jgi:class 3 adenylate cyclase|nr:adenylate/guanylate cyclase domain-containing protein [Rhodocyclaceae bacterium]
MLTLPSLPSECTVLFADLVGSTQLYERVGDSSAFQAVDGCIQEMKRIVSGRSGQVIKHTGDGLMAVFAHPDQAADAAVSMHLKVRDQPPDGGQRLAVRVGFQYGPVITKDSDVFGETVNFAARLAELASPGRAITSQDTARRLSPEWRGLLNALPPRVLRGASRPIEIYELKCESVGDVTLLQAPSLMQEEQPELRLYMGNLAFLLDARRPVIRIGRDQSSDLQIGDSRASRKHAEIELRGDKFVLIDRSSNGTFVAIEGEKEFILSREEAVLRGKGHIALGSTCTANPYAISFVCM